MDVNSVFSYGYIKAEVYVKQPSRFKNLSSSNHVFKILLFKTNPLSSIWPFNKVSTSNQISNSKGWYNTLY